MKHLSLFLAGLVLMGALLAIVCCPTPRPPAIKITSQGPTVERLAQLMHLVTTRVYVADVLTAEGDGYRGAWLIKGDALIGVNLHKAEITEKDFQSRQATICLSQPEVLQSRVDHERTRTWEVRKTTWVPWGGDPDSLRDSVMRHGQRLVAAAANSPENIAQARTAAEAILRGFYEEIGWQVRIVWRDSTSRQPLQKSSMSAVAASSESLPLPHLPTPRPGEIAHPSPRVTIRRGVIASE